MWQAMFEHTSRDIDWLREVANLLEQHARARARAPMPPLHAKIRRRRI
jgi:hypothetical protein